eukprot:Sdes_comp17863_c0_seq1m7130
MICLLRIYTTLVSCKYPVDIFLTPYLFRSLSQSRKQSKEYQNDETQHQSTCPPPNCCMSGCANCVLDDYYREMAERNSPLKNDMDPALKAFLEMEEKIKESK